MTYAPRANATTRASKLLVSFRSTQPPAALEDLQCRGSRAKKIVEGFGSQLESVLARTILLVDRHVHRLLVPKAAAIVEPEMQRMLLVEPARPVHDEVDGQVQPVVGRVFYGPESVSAARTFGRRIRKA